MTSNPSAADPRLSTAAIRPLRTLDPAGPMDDLEWLDDAIGDARVVAIGESAHYNRESYQLRHRLLRYLVERHGFGAYALEHGFTEGWPTDIWVRGGAAASQLGRLMGDGMTSLMLLWKEMRAHLEWMRRHNLTEDPIGFYGIDLGGCNVSLLPGLDAVTAYLAHADPDFSMEPGLRETAAACTPASAFSIPTAISAHGDLSAGTRDALTAGLAEIAARMTGRRLEYLQRTTAESYERAMQSLRLVITLDTVVRAAGRDDRKSVMSNRDAAIADTVEWILRRQDRVVVAAHNAHIQCWPTTQPFPPGTTMGMHLADRLGEDYLAIGTTTGSGETLNTGPDFFSGKLFTDLGPPLPGTLDALMHDSHDGPFATDLRRLPPADTEAVAAVTQQRYGTVHVGQSPLDAYDVLVHLPEVTAAEPDEDAVAHSPDEVQRAFSRR